MLQPHQQQVPLPIDPSRIRKRYHHLIRSFTSQFPQAVEALKTKRSQAAPPDGPVVGEIWADPTTDPEQWVEYTWAVRIETTAPARTSQGVAASPLPWPITTAAMAPFQKRTRGRHRRMLQHAAVSSPRSTPGTIECLAQSHWPDSPHPTSQSNVKQQQAALGKSCPSTPPNLQSPHRPPTSRAQLGSRADPGTVPYDQAKELSVKEMEQEIQANQGRSRLQLPIVGTSESEW